MNYLKTFLLLIPLFFLITELTFSQNPIGLFEKDGDIGHILHSGSVEYNSDDQIYTIAGSGVNMWFASDAFYFVWKKVSGDVSLAADIKWIGTGGTSPVASNRRDEHVAAAKQRTGARLCRANKKTRRIKRLVNEKGGG